VTVPRLNPLIKRARRVGVQVIWMREVRPEAMMLGAQKVLYETGEEHWLIREDGDGIDWYEGVLRTAAWHQGNAG